MKKQCEKFSIQLDNLAIIKYYIQTFVNFKGLQPFKNRFFLCPFLANFTRLQTKLLQIHFLTEVQINLLIFLSTNVKIRNKIFFSTCIFFFQFSLILLCVCLQFIIENNMACSPCIYVELLQNTFLSVFENFY